MDGIPDFPMTELTKEEARRRLATRHAQPYRVIDAILSDTEALEVLLADRFVRRERFDSECMERSDAEREAQTLRERLDAEETVCKRLYEQFSLIDSGQHPNIIKRPTNSQQTTELLEDLELRGLMHHREAVGDGVPWWRVVPTEGAGSDG